MRKAVDLATAAFKEIEDLERYSAQELKRAETFTKYALLRNPKDEDEIREHTRRYLNTMQRIIRNANADILAIIKEEL